MKTILHLCAKEGSDSLPYREAGYDVRIIGEDIGVENYNPPENVYGIIANPPCTHFSIARTNAKKPRDLKEGMRLVQECLRIIWACQYQSKSISFGNSPLKFWVIENPSTGYLKWFLGKPVFEYQPYEYGENYSKQTGLWGYFNLPARPLLFNPIRSHSNLAEDKEICRKMGKNGRSLCPINFAKAFFAANP